MRDGEKKILTKTVFCFWPKVVKFSEKRNEFTETFLKYQNYPMMEETKKNNLLIWNVILVK